MTTFGVELECVLMFPEDYTVKNPHKDYKFRPHQINGIYLLHDVLAKPFTAECPRHDCTETHEYYLPLRGTDPKEGHDSNDYTRWQVTCDVSVDLTKEKEQPMLPANIQVAGLEIISRILNINKPTTCPSGQTDHHGGIMAFPWQWEIFHMLRVLNDHFSTTANHRLTTNENCGLHVHIGNGIESLPVKSVQSMMALFTAFERQLDSMNSTPRIGGCYRSTMETSMPIPRYQGPRRYNYVNETGFVTVNETTGEYCRPMSGLHLDFAVGEIVPDLREPGLRDQTVMFPNKLKAVDSNLALALRKNNPLSWLYTVMSVVAIQDINDYIEVAGGQEGKNLSINFDNVTDEPSKSESKETLEFRSHVASLDAAKICAWVDVVSKMAHFCATATYSHLAKALIDGFQNADFSFVNLAELVGASEKTQNHYRKALGKDYAIKRWAKIAKQEIMAADDMSRSGLIATIEKTRLYHKQQNHVEEKIRHKFEDGLYGVMPRSVGVRIMGPRANEPAAEPLFTAIDDWFDPHPSSPFTPETSDSGRLESEETDSEHGRTE